MKDDRVGNKKLLMARSDKRYMKICRQLCDMCQKMKNYTEAPVGKLKLSEVSEKLWTHLIVDFIIKLLLAARKNIILVVYNKLSKMTHFVATIPN